jgi:hypothetical protein
LRKRKIQMPNLNDWQPNEPIQVLVYGKAKLGKTFGALSFPRPVVLDFDDGIATGRSPEFIAKYGLRGDIEYQSFHEKGKRINGVLTQHNAFDDACRYFDSWMQPAKVNTFDTWIIDSGTTLSERAMTKAIIVLGMGSKPLSQTQSNATATGVISAKLQDYGSERSLVEQFVQMVLDSRKNVVMLCHEKEVTDDQGNVLEYVPLLTGQSAERVPLKFDEVYNLRGKKVGMEFVRYLQTVPDGLRKVGSRYGVPNETKWDYTALRGVLNKIKEDQAKVQEKAKATAAGTTVPATLA